jgi:hypothetical protein
MVCALHPRILASCSTVHARRAISMAMVSDKRFTGHGIRDALIPLLPDMTEKRVCSSSNRFPVQTGEHRNSAGEAVWRRLEAIGRARYDTDHDRFFLI